MEEFRKFVTEKVYLSEKTERAFSSWMFMLDNMREQAY